MDNTKLFDGSNLTFEEFNRLFFYKQNIKWFDRKGIMKFGHTVATITLSTHGVHEHYEGYLVRVTTLEHELDTQFFDFNTYLKARIDTRNDLPNQKFEIVTHIGTHWFIAIPSPTDVEKMAATIIDYVKTLVYDGMP